MCPGGASPLPAACTVSMTTVSLEIRTIWRLNLFRSSSFSIGDQVGIYRGVSFAMDEHVPYKKLMFLDIVVVLDHSCLV